MSVTIIFSTDHLTQITLFSLECIFYDYVCVGMVVASPIYKGTLPPPPWSTGLAGGGIDTTKLGGRLLHKDSLRKTKLILP